MDTVKIILAMAEQFSHSSTPFWTKIYRMLCRLTEEGMSDEESVYQRASNDLSDTSVVKARCIRQPGFRQRELTKILAFLDLARTTDGLQVPTDKSSIVHRLPITRVSEVDNSQPSPSRSQPRVFLDAQWMQKTPSHLFSVVEEVWDLPSLHDMEAHIASLLQQTNIPRS